MPTELESRVKNFFGELFEATVNGFGFAVGFILAAKLLHEFAHISICG